MPDIIRERVAASTTSVMALKTLPVPLHGADMQWMVEFDGQQLPMDAVWDNDVAKVVGPSKATIEKALARAAEPDELRELKVIVFAEDEGEAPVWGFKFAGAPHAVKYAIDLMGKETPIMPPSH